MKDTNKSNKSMKDTNKSNKFNERIFDPKQKKKGRRNRSINSNAKPSRSDLFPNSEILGDRLISIHLELGFFFTTFLLNFFFKKNNLI